MNQYMATLAKNLKELMGDMTVCELSKNVGIAQPTLSRYLLCQRQIALENLTLLADYFHVEIDVLLGRKDD